MFRSVNGKAVWLEIGTEEFREGVKGEGRRKPPLKHDHVSKRLRPKGNEEISCWCSRGVKGVRRKVDERSGGDNRQARGKKEQGECGQRFPRHLEGKPEEGRRDRGGGGRSSHFA